MPYKITIEKKTVEEGFTEREWRETGERDGEGRSVYAYTPQVETKKAVTRTIYEQWVDDLDLVNVIRAINNILTDVTD